MKLLALCNGHSSDCRGGGLIIVKLILQWCFICLGFKMQYPSVVASMLQCSGGGGGGHGGGSLTLLATLLFGVVVALFIFVNDFGDWVQRRWHQEGGISTAELGW